MDIISILANWTSACLHSHHSHTCTKAVETHLHGLPSQFTRITTGLSINLKKLFYMKYVWNCCKELCSPTGVTLSTKHQPVYDAAQCCILKRWSRTPYKLGPNTHQRKVPWNYPLGSACWDKVKILCIINLHLFWNNWQISPFVFYSPVNAWSWGLLTMQCLGLAGEVTSSSGHNFLHSENIFH